MSAEKKITFQIDGMHCRSCEVLIERSAKELPGVKGVRVDAKTGIANLYCCEEANVDAGTLERAIGNADYHVRLPSETAVAVKAVKPSIPEIIFLFAVVYIAGWLLGQFGFLQAGFDATSQVTVVGSFLLGLLAGTSSCLAVSGGLLLSSVAKVNERLAQATTSQRMVPVALFVIGRVVSYGLFGGLIGLVGKALVPSPAVTASLTIIAAGIMVVMGLQMLGLAPAWLMNALPRMPKFMSHGALAATGPRHGSAPTALAPLFLGGATFFLPCGFTQSLQIYALTTGSAVTSGLILASFALGTAPMLLALGAASTSLKGKAGYWFFRFSGALVITLGLLNLKSGVLLSGFSLPTINFSTSTPSALAAEDPNVKLVNNEQLIALTIAANPAYLPSDHYTVKAGIPVRMEIHGKGTGCRSIFTIPKEKISIPLNKDLNVLTFTPDKKGRLTFTCSMGMYSGTIDVI
ncbi:MAG: sulfite exporter TauE/SafE family protein [Patescibacteria group bacterium]|jgi:sulfite exporter TauE/SafE/copper chaperone CopZ